VCRTLNYRQVRELVKAFNQIFPGFNSQLIDKMSVERFAEMATTIGFQFQSLTLHGGGRTCPQGFLHYAQEGPAQASPDICEHGASPASHRNLFLS